MLPFTDALWSALRSHQTGFFTAVASYQGSSATVRVASGSLSFRAAGQVQSSGALVAAGKAPSLAPSSPTDLLAPFGQEIALFRTVLIGARGRWEIPLGVYRITRAGDIVENFRGDTVLDWSVGLSFSDRLKKIRDDDFLEAVGPVAGNTVWQEVRRLSSIPVQTTLGDAAVPPGTVYESRIAAITQLLSLLGAVPHVTRAGVLTARLADRWLTATTPDVTVEGVIRYSSELTDDFFNQVQVKSSNDASIVAYASIRDDSNYLSVNRAGGRTFRQSSPIYATQAAADAAAATILKRVSTRRARTVTVECTPEALLLEMGDMVLFQDPVKRKRVLGEVSGMRMPLSPTASIPLDVIVSEESDYTPGG